MKRLDGRMGTEHDDEEGKKVDLLYIIYKLQWSYNVSGSTERQGASKARMFLAANFKLQSMNIFVGFVLVGDILDTKLFIPKSIFKTIALVSESVLIVDQARILEIGVSAYKV